MPTYAASGQSVDARTESAVQEAMRQALAGLNDRPATAGILFVASQHKLARALSAADAAAPGVAIIGCTTAGELTERGVLRNGVVVLLLATDAVVARGYATGAKADPERAAAQLCDGYADAQRRATSQGAPSSTSILLVDGLSGAGDKLVSGVLKQTRAFQQIVGGAAGDDGAFVATHVGAGSRATSDGAAALHFFGPRRWGVGVDHGLRPGPTRHHVTRAEGNVVHEIDHRPAFDLYRTHAKARGIDLSPSNAGPYLIANELGVFFLDELRAARAPLSVDKAGALTCAAEVPEDATIAILDGDPDQMVAAARRAAQEAHAALAGTPAAAVLVFDCVCRAAILGDGVSRELDAIRGVFPKTPIAGFFTYGEIARTRGKLDGWHNTTAVVVAIPAD